MGREGKHQGNQLFIQAVVHVPRLCLKVIDEIPPVTAARPPLSPLLHSGGHATKPPQAECLSTRKNDHKTPYLRFAVTTPTPPIHNALWLMSTPLNRMAGVKASALQSGSTVPVSKKNKPQVAPVCYPQLHTIKRMNYKKKGKPH
jgi:hypothetical protein